MIFSTYWFVGFALFLFGIINLIPGVFFRRQFLIVACMIFHTYFAGAAGIVPIIFLGILTYLAPLLVLRYQDRYSWVRSLLVGVIVICVSSLLWYKYTGFLLNSLAGLFSGELQLLLLYAAKSGGSIATPLAISFFVFEFCHYLVEVRRGGEPIRRVDEFILFAIFFPTLVAGPIKRYQPFLNEIKNSDLKVSSVNLTSGFSRIVIGLVKKTFIADTATKIITDMYSVGAGSGLSTLAALSFILLLYVRIYMDFSGYSDIAIGLAKILGISIPENFRYPFLASNLSDFWHRWHISLSTWVRDYIYIPLGGNRVPFYRKAINAFIAIALCGLWHGPAAHFILWGVFHGVGLFIQNTYNTTCPRPLKRVLDSIPGWSHAVTFCFVSISWVIFFYSPSDTQKILGWLF